MLYHAGRSGDGGGDSLERSARVRFLPFGGWARNVEGLVAEGPITGPANERRSDMPYVDVEQGTAKNELRVNWLAASKGRVQVRVRMDNPL